MKRSILSRGIVPAALVLSLALAACGDSDDDTADDADDAVEEVTDEAEEADEDMDEGGEAVSGTIEIDGSSTVGPLTDALAEEYAVAQPDVTINLGISGSGGGFQRFCEIGDTDISNASRPIEDDEVAACEESGIEFTEVRVGTDALTMVVNQDTDFVQCLTTDELVSIWGPDGVSNWSEVNPEFPDQALEIFAPGTDSGTYDFFNETILEPNDIEEPRQDFNASEDDNIIAQGIQGTTGAWGFFGFAYFVENQDVFTAVEYDAGEGCVGPSVETAQDDSYGLTRPLFIYVKNEALARPEVADFVNFYLATVDDVIEDVGYVPATEDDIAEAQANVDAALAEIG